jgi:chemotaxis protein MotB
MKRIEEEGHENSERWLLTYSDLITLLMIFFVIMYAMSSISENKYNQLAQSLNAAMGGGGNLIGSGNSVNNNPGVQIVDSEETKLENLKGEIDKYIQNSGLSKSVTTQIDERGVVVRLENSILFESGSAALKDGPKKEIVELGKILGKLGNYIRVEGHTDNVPLRGREFKSNWQLSAIRATNVAEMLISEAGIAPDKVVAMGYGEYRPIASNSTNEGRAQNRRVDIVVVNSKFDKIEDTKN